MLIGRDSDYIITNYSPLNYSKYQLNISLSYVIHSLSKLTQLVSCKYLTYFRQRKPSSKRPGGVCLASWLPGPLAFMRQAAYRGPTTIRQSIVPPMHESKIDFWSLSLFLPHGNLTGSTWTLHERFCGKIDLFLVHDEENYQIYF
jgi:hypothetical protein